MTATGYPGAEGRKGAGFMPFIRDIMGFLKSLLFGR